MLMYSFDVFKCAPNTRHAFTSTSGLSGDLGLKKGQPRSSEYIFSTCNTQNITYTSIHFISVSETFYFSVLKVSMLAYMVERYTD